MLGFPSPRVRMLPQDNAPTKGLARDGQSYRAFGTLEISIDGLPEIWRTNPNLRAQVELLRYVPTRRKLDPPNGYVKMPGGLYHPSPPNAGSGSGGTRGGTINSLGPDVVRPTEWPIFGLPFGGSIALTVAEVLLPYFQQMDVTDGNGTTIPTLVYRWKSNQRKGSKGVKWYNRSPLLGVFYFRFAGWDEISQRWVTGPLSEPVYAFPLKTPIIPAPGGSSSYARLGQINPQPPPENYLMLTAQVGARIR